MADLTIPDGGPVQPVDLREALEERYLAYALSTIMGRALPDARDGLKPVHRRVLFAMRQLRLDPDGGFKKCARVVGDVIGKFHPHGDQAVYDALVRLAQGFAQRYTLVDGQGNFGNVDGDNAAAMRYTEARLTDFAMALLEGIDEDAVDFRETYDGEDSEPVVLPAAVPNLLANGSSGIAVGMATSIPPHNLEELCDAALYLIRNPNAGAEKLIDFVPGPDFPTGGVIVETRAAIIEAYNTGRGGFRVRARWSREDTGRGGYQIVVTEIPYQVQKSRLIEKIAELMEARKLPLVGDIRDESAEDIRIVIEPKSRSVDPTLLMESLFKLTELEVRFPLNMNVLSRGRVPMVLSLAQVLNEWLGHRREVLLRRSRHRLVKIEHRLEVLGGLLVAYLNLDEVIRIIRFEDEPKPVLMQRFKLSDVQAEAILNMRLRSLRKLEEIEIRTENDALNAERAELVALVASPERQKDRIAAEIEAVRAKFGKATSGGARRSSFGEMPVIEADLDQAFIEREPVTILVSEKGWIRSLKGHQDDLGKVQFKSGDGLWRAMKAQTSDKLVLFASNGKFYTLDCAGLPGGRSQGEPLRLMIDLEEGDAIIEAFVHRPGRKLLVASRQGNGFIVAEDEVLASTRKGKQVMIVTPPDAAVACVPAEGDSVAVLGENRKLIVFPLAEVNELARGRGVRLQRYREGGLADVQVFDGQKGVIWADNAGKTRVLADLAGFRGARAGAGQSLPKGVIRGGRFGVWPFEER